MTVTLNDSVDDIARDLLRAGIHGHTVLAGYIKALAERTDVLSRHLTKALELLDGTSSVVERQAKQIATLEQRADAPSLNREVRFK